MPSSKEHWERIYSSKAEDQLSWFQPYPRTSVAFIELFDLPQDANIIDIGGGESRFVDVLLEKGYKNIYVLDISEKAIELSKKRLKEKAGLVHWIISDIADFTTGVKFDFWHDRAAFHFLTSEKIIDHYVSLAENHIRPEGYLVLGTFSERGPTQCSGLEIKQYNDMSMSLRFEKGFERIKCITEKHITPSKNIQEFLFCSFRKKF